jgi:hypothetical protein
MPPAGLVTISPPTRLSRDLLIRGVAHMVQEGALGGLSLTTRRRLRSLSEGSDQRSGAAAAPSIVLKPGRRPPQDGSGTKLIREWHGQAHTVSAIAGNGCGGSRCRDLFDPGNNGASTYISGGCS